MYYHLRGHLDYNFKQDSNIPLPCDYLAENDLSIRDVYKWLPTITTFDKELETFNIINEQKLAAFKAIRRKYVFIIASHQKNIDSFKIEKLFRPRYGEGVMSLNKKDRLQDYMSLRNAILLIDTLKQNNCYRNVFLLRDSQRSIEHCYRYLCSSHFNRFKDRFLMPPIKHEFHNSLKFMQYYPCSILKGRLYLGDANHATNWYVLNNMRITHVANITDCVQNPFDNDKSGISYCQIEVEDTVGEDLSDYFPQFYWFLEDAFSSNLRLDYDVPDTVEGLKKYNYDFKEKKVTKDFDREIDKEFELIANETVKKVTMNKVLVHC